VVVVFTSAHELPDSRCKCAVTDPSFLPAVVSVRVDVRGTALP
jgi:hypothetical protein